MKAVNKNNLYDDMIKFSFPLYEKTIFDYFPLPGTGTVYALISILPISSFSGI